MEPVRIGSKREVCWDWYLAAEIENISLDMHKPVRKNVALSCDAPWEGGTCAYPAVIKVGDTYRLYYRASGRQDLKDESFCVAESKDGKTFSRPELCIFDVNGSKKNNIFFREDRFVDNFSVHYDTNPECPPDAKFKALSLIVSEDFTVTQLGYYKSPDGIHFKYVGILPIPGIFDTHNVVLWDEKNKIYRMYIRNFHDENGETSKYDPNTAMEKAIRDVRLTISTDFMHWSEPKKLEYAPGTPDLQLYTNQIIQYPRADIYLGMPTRYIDRAKDAVNFQYLPKWGGERQMLIEKGDRVGTAQTDCVLMTSRDGFHFDRTDEAFMTPGIEQEYNWVYGDCYVSHGICETVSDYDGDTAELSFYAGEGYRNQNVFVRYTVRMDGFFSWHGKFDGGMVLTVPLIFDGEAMQVNFASSALGSLRIQICDSAGVPIEGYDSGILFGDSLKRNVDFEKPLSQLSGETVRIRFQLQDCDLYSFKFE